MKLSVCIITYNHEKYISDCIDSLLHQDASFEYEIIVAEDCSKDRTRDLVTAYRDRHPSKIRLVLPPANVGGTQNFLNLHNAALGEYVAHVDGDDIALPGKIAKQVALLDADPTLSVCGHAMGVMDAAGTPHMQRYPHRLPSRFGLPEAIKYGMPILNSSVMYRRSCRRLNSADFEVYDWYFLTDLLMNGRAGFIDEELGRYRINPRSTSSSEGNIKMLNGLMGAYARRFPDLVEYKAEFFAYALFDLLECLRRGYAVSNLHWKLLRDSISPLGPARFIDTFIWRLENLGTLTR